MWLKRLATALIQIIRVEDKAAQSRPMEDRAEPLRRLIALYRRYLREGVDSALAETYLRELQKAETALERLKQRSHSEV